MSSSRPLTTPSPGNGKCTAAPLVTESQQDCTFTQKDSDLTGSCRSDRGTVEIKGKVDGKSVTWSYTSDSPGGQVTVVYKGTIDSADKISGKVIAVEFSIEGDFTATRVK